MNEIAAERTGVLAFAPVLWRVALLAVACNTTGAFAHHSPGSTYYTDRIVEIEGEIEALVWRNPHVRFTIAVAAADGRVESWDVEGAPVTRLHRAAVSADVVAVGQRVTIAGNPSRQPDHRLYARNMLLADGREVLLGSPRPRWTTATVGTGRDSTPGDSAGDPALGLFRVWSADATRLEIDADREFLTAAARAAEAAWNPFAPDNPFLGCTRGMPTLMESPNPIEFVDRGDRLLLRMESFDAERTIWLAPDAIAADAPPTLLGHSFGHWDGAALVVATDRISWRHYSQVGWPSSDALTLVERFVPSADGARLAYSLTVTDPALFTQPMTFEKSFVWVPGDAVLPFDCAER